MEKYRIGIMLKKIRKSRSLTLKMLAEKSGLSISYISDIERNRANPSLERLNDLSQALDIPISVLLGENLDYQTSQKSLTIKDEGYDQYNNRLEKVISSLKYLNNWPEDDFLELIYYINAKNLTITRK
ncbi:MAG: helix-turn-helix domain-containing protein [Eubacteriaceae bacterium]